MGKPTAALAWCAVVAIGLAGSRAGANEQATPADITVVVTDFARVAPRILDRAEVEAGRTYRRIGVETIWRDAAAFDAETARGATTDPGFTIKLIIQPRAAAPGARGVRTIMAAALSLKSDRDGAIYVFYDRVTDVASWHDTDTGLLMGIVIAHEIGHVLLRHSRHSLEGLMRDVWDSDDIRRAASGMLWFSPSESETMRATLSVCCAARLIPLK
jgi:hypothetical protein